MPTTPTPPRATPMRGLYADQWLLDAFRRAGDPAVALASERVADSAWDALESAGVPTGRLVEIACATAGVPRAELAAVGLEHARLLPRDVAQRYNVVAMRLRADNIVEVACANPLRLGLEQELAFSGGRRVVLHVAAPAEIRAAIERVYKEEAAKLDAMHPSIALRLPGGGNDESSEAVLLTDRIIAEALTRGGSDLHLEPTAKGPLRVRIRVDGVLQDVLDVRPDLAAFVVSRLKVSAGLDVADRIRPQDGRATIKYQDRSIDLRVSTLPLGGIGEKVVIRVLDGSVADVGLENLGFLGSELTRLRRALSLPEGLVLCTGPTGSGKTTTLYSALRHVHSTEKNIVTVEDPIEYRLAGINQVQTNERAGLTFAAALRSILRQDPDVVLVGEIRDKETADIAVKASMTGHLVLSTLHTNDAPSAVSRMLDVGADSGSLAGALKAVVAQRLVRRLCAACTVPMTADELTPEHRALLAGHDLSKLRKPVGCPTCRGSGHKGRMVVAEVMVVTPELQRAIARGADVRELTDLAKASGTVNLWEAGLQRVAAGATSLGELLDNVAAPVLDEQHSQASVDALLAQLLGTLPAVPATPALADPAPQAAPAISGAWRAAQAAAGPRVVPPAPVAPVTRAPGTPALRVLVVHDDRAARGRLRRLLEESGHAVMEAADGEAALAYATRLAPDLVVTELALPRLDGIGLLQALARMADAPRVVVCTSQQDTELHAWAREVGAVDVLPADAPAADLVASVARRAALRAG